MRFEPTGVAAVTCTPGSSPRRRSAEATPAASISAASTVSMGTAICERGARQRTRGDHDLVHRQRVAVERESPLGGDCVRPRKHPRPISERRHLDGAARPPRVSRHEDAGWIRAHAEHIGAVRPRTTAGRARRPRDDGRPDPRSRCLIVHAPPRLGADRLRCERPDDRQGDAEAQVAAHLDHRRRWNLTEGYPESPVAL